MLAKTLVVYSMCSLLTYILCTLCVFSGYIYFNMSNKKLPYHTIPNYHRIALTNLSTPVISQSYNETLVSLINTNIVNKLKIMIVLYNNNYDRYCALYIFTISARASSERRVNGQ